MIEMTFRESAVHLYHFCKLERRGRLCRMSLIRSRVLSVRRRGSEYVESFHVVGEKSRFALELCLFSNWCHSCGIENIFLWEGR